MRELFDALTSYYLGSNKQCAICERELPNKDMKTKNGCIWCDSLYYRNKK